MPDVTKLIIDGVQYDLPQGGGPQYPLYISPLSGTSKVRDGNVVGVLYANNNTAALMVNGAIQADYTYGQYRISNQSFDSANNRMKFTYSTVLATISGNVNDISDVDGNGIDYTNIYKHTLVVNNITAYNQPWVSGRVYIDGYDLEMTQVGSDNAISLLLFCEIDATQSMTREEISHAMMGGYDTPFCTFCGKVIVSAY